MLKKLSSFSLFKRRKTEYIIKNLLMSQVLKSVLVPVCIYFVNRAISVTNCLFLFAHYLATKIAAKIFNKFDIMAHWLLHTSAVSLFLPAFCPPASFGNAFTTTKKMTKEMWHWVIFRSRLFSTKIWSLNSHTWKKSLW